MHIFTHRYLQSAGTEHADECIFEASTACLVQLVLLVRWSEDFSLSGRR